jgi:hypothetical protein
MTNFVLVLASNWQGAKVRCRFTALADGKPVAPTDDTAPVFQLPDGTAEVRITATPTAVSPKVPVHWEKTVVLTVGSSGGPLTAKTGSTAFVKLSPPKPIGSGMQYTLATIQLSRFKDATADVVKLLMKLPTKRSFSDDQGVTWYDKQVDAVKEVQNHVDNYGDWPPAKWDPNAGPDVHFWDLNAVPNAHFLDPEKPVLKSGVLNFTKGALPAIDVESLVLQIAGTDVPQLFAVTWPTKTVERTATSGPTPFFLFIRQSNNGNHYDWDGLFVGGDLNPYPNNFDYADEGLFANLHYGHSPLREPWLKGVPYQAAMAGNKVVTVAPCNKFGDEFGVLAKTKQTGRILEEIQAFMFWKAGIADPPKTVGDTAIAAFSSGTFHLDNWLRDPDNLNDKFLSNVVKAVYWLDPRTDYVDRFIEASLAWAGSPDRDKRIRLYMRYPSAAHQKLLGTSPSAPYVQNTTGDKRTAAVITDENWAKVVTKYLGGAPFAKVEWTYSHHAICATMLTHALRWDFK